MRIQSLQLLLIPILCGLGASSCFSRSTPTVNGTCQVDPAVSCAVGDASAETVNLTGYSCSGTARPDDNSVYVDGIPQGPVCSDRGTTSDGKNAYCCTNFTTQCSLDPTITCPTGTYGYQCYGQDRPEAVNPAISCHQGVREDNWINYCCAGTKTSGSCTNSNAVGCKAGLTGWACPVGTQPTAEDLGASSSRADLFYLLCPVPTPAANPKYETYCCYTAPLVPAGGTCLQDRNVPNCAAGRFGIACYGTDTPEQDFARLSCPDPGVPGLSEQGYAATVYCCDFASD